MFFYRRMTGWVSSLRVYAFYKEWLDVSSFLKYVTIFFSVRLSVLVLWRAVIAPVVNLAHKDYLGQWWVIN